MGRKASWNSGKTTAIRIPEQFADRLVEIARAWDVGAAAPQAAAAVGEPSTSTAAGAGEPSTSTGEPSTSTGEPSTAAAPLHAMDQLMSPLNPAACWFQWQGKPVKGRAVGCLVDWSSGLVSAVLIDWELEGRPQQIQLPIERVEFRTKPAAVPTWEGKLIDGYLIWLLPQCRRLGLEPWQVLKRLMQVWRRNETLERSA